jgi:hypothetical protein
MINPGIKMQSTVTTRLRKEGLPVLLSVLMAALPLRADQVAPEAPQQQAPGQPAAPAATPPAPPQAPSALPTAASLKVVPLAGKGEANDLERKIMAPLVVEVLDQNDRPVEGAEVVFRFPINGPGATFPGGKTSQTVRTNSQGQAAAMNWLANDQVGRFDVHVNASYGNQVGETTFQMSNAAKVVQKPGNNGFSREKHSWFSPTWVKVAIIAGGAALAVGIVLATRGGGSAATTATSPTVTITPGPPTVGAPH